MTEKTILQEAIREAFVGMFGSDDYQFGTSGKLSRKVDQLTDDQIVALFRYGKRLFNDNYNSMKNECKTKGKNPTSEQSFFDAWIVKLGVSIGTDDSTRGPRMSPEDAGWVAYLNKDMKHKEGGEVISSKSLPRAKRTLCRQALIADGVPLAEIEAMLTDENIAAWAAWFEKEDEKLAKRIDAERPASAKTIVKGWRPN